MHAQYFALVDFNLKLQICEKASFSLLLILLGYFKFNVKWITGTS